MAFMVSGKVWGWAVIGVLAAGGSGGGDYGRRARAWQPPAGGAALVMARPTAVPHTRAIDARPDLLP
jgi:hypothetical protein